MSLVFVSQKKDRLYIFLHVQPKSSKNQVVGIYNDRLKIKITSPPVDGAANKAVQVFLSKLLSISKREIIIEAGQASRQKTVSIPFSEGSVECLQKLVK